MSIDQWHCAANGVRVRDGRGESGRDGHSGQRQDEDGDTGGGSKHRHRTKTPAASRLDNDEGRVKCFVPGEDVDPVVLAAYLRHCVDGTATMQLSDHPTGRGRIGWMVSADASLSATHLADILKDSARWRLEQKGKSYRRDPYGYTESDTFSSRMEWGMSMRRNAPVIQPRERDRDTRLLAETQPHMPKGKLSARGGQTCSCVGNMVVLTN